MIKVPFTRDEAILAVDTLLSSEGNSLSPVSPVVIELSKLLNELPIHSMEKRAPYFRNPVGISSQLHNFEYALKSYKSTFRVGTIFFRIYEEYRDCPEQLHAIAEAIRKNKEFFSTQFFGNELEGNDFQEGALLFHLHRVLEARDSRKIVLAESCEICHLNLCEVYKPIPGSFLQSHLLVPVTELEGSKRYKADDFITVCPNCHAVLHRYRPWVTRKKAEEILF